MMITDSDFMIGDMWGRFDYTEGQYDVHNYRAHGRIMFTKNGYKRTNGKPAKNNVYKINCI